jgi:formyl-CoA transferase
VSTNDRRTDDNVDSAGQPGGPLAGVRVLSLGTMLGLGHATALLSDFGAEVIAVEMPGRGDSLRGLGPYSDGHSLRWAVVGRGKRSVTVDMHSEAGRDIVRGLVMRSDVVAENFRPGTLQQWGLGWEALKTLNPKIILLSLSGYGQTGPARHKPGFGRVIEAACGLMNSTGDSDGPPMQIGAPLVDYIAGTVGAMAVAMALVERDGMHASGRGQWIDHSLYETMVRLLDALMSSNHVRGRPPRRQGNRYANSVPSDVYTTSDGRYVFHSSATQTVFARLAKLIGRTDMLTDPRYATNAARIRRVDEVNDIVQEWFSRHDRDEAVRLLEEADVPVGPVREIDEVVADEQLLGRESVVCVEVPGVGLLPQPGVVPKFGRTPGRVTTPGPELGADTDDILTRLLDYSPERMADLRRDGVV